MSQWTHVAAVIRFDELPRTTEIPDFSGIPCGSEGPLHYRLKRGKPNIAAMYVATIWGDLRDYDDADAIQTYLTKITNGHEIRSGVAEIEVRGKFIRTLRFSHEDWEDGKWEVACER